MSLQFGGKGSLYGFETTQAHSTPVQFFYQHELLKNYKYYWRVEYVPIYLLSCLSHLRHLCRPEVKFFCNLDYDPFLFMQDNDKVYSECCAVAPARLFWPSPPRLYHLSVRMGTYSSYLVENCQGYVSLLSRLCQIFHRYWCRIYGWESSICFAKQLDGFPVG